MWHSWMRGVSVLGPSVAPAEVLGGDATGARARWALGDRTIVLYTSNADAYQDLPVTFAALARVPQTMFLVHSRVDARV